MADNVIASLAVGTGPTFRTVNRSSVNTPVTIIDLGGEAGPELLLVPGQATKANSLPVTIASDQGNLSASVTQATAANLNATVVGTGTFAVQATGTVTANIGTTNGLALDSSVAGLQVSQGSTTSGQKGGLELGAVTTAAPSYTTGQSSPISLTTGGAQRMDITTIAGTAPTTVGKLDVKGADGDVFVRQATAANLNATVVGTGTFAVQAAQSGTWNTRVADSAGTGITSTGGALDVNIHGASANVTISNAFALDASVNGILISQASSITSKTGPLIQGSVTTAAPSYTTAQVNPLSLTTSGALRSDITTIAGTAPTTAGKVDVKGADGDVFVRQATAANLNATVVGTGTFAVQAAQSGAPWSFTQSAATSGGWTPGSYISASGANQDATQIKGSGGQLGFVFCTNINAAVRYCKIYDKATGVTSADTPKLRMAIPGNTAGAGFALPFGAGSLFSNGIQFRFTTGSPDNDTGAVASGDIILNYGFA